MKPVNIELDAEIVVGNHRYPFTLYVSGRLNDLKKAGEIVFVEKRPSRTTGKLSEFWRVKQFNENLF